MRWSEISDVRCSVARSLSVVGDRWTLLVLREAFLGTRRFDDLQAGTGMARHLLAERLRTLTEHGVLERRRYSERPERFEYLLTEKGRDLYPVIAALVAWGDRWMADEHGPPLEMVHEPCGHAITPALACPACSEWIEPQDMRPQPVER